MEAGIVALLTVIGGLVLAFFKHYTGPSAKERQKRKEKEATDEALRKGDLNALSKILNDHRDRNFDKLRNEIPGDTGLKGD